MESGYRLAIVLTLLFDGLTTAFLGFFLLSIGPDLARAVARPEMRVAARLLPLLVVAFAAHGVVLPAPAAAATPRVLAIRFGPDLEVNPVTRDYVNHQLDEAAKHYDAAVIELDTPGGLSSSLRAIYQKELSLRIP
jgi:membrane-bound ClpP family serine protease